MSKNISRRLFLRNTSIVGLGAPVVSKNTNLINKDTKENIGLHWLDTIPNGFNFGTTFGIPWERGKIKDSNSIYFNSDNKSFISSQNWPLAYWPDGSLKWSAHALAISNDIQNQINVSIGKRSITSKNEGIQIIENKDYIQIDTGKLKCKFNQIGNILIDHLSIGNKTIGTNGILILINQENGIATNYTSKIEQISVEQKGNIRTVVKIEGKHSNHQREWLPFVLRFYFYSNSDAIKILHTIIYDGNENQDFIKGIGLQLEVNLEQNFYNRHVKFADIETKGIFSESVQNLTGLRRDPGEIARQNQINGLFVNENSISETVKNGLKYVPIWSEYKLNQLYPESYSIQKRTKDGYSWLNSHYGNQAYGVGFIGDTSGGLTFGIRNFRKSFPNGIHINNLDKSSATLQLWLWSPDAEPMDLRFYHDGLGEDTYEKQRDALDITYEDYEPNFGKPLGVARTSEFWLKLEQNVPTNQELIQYAAQIQNPLQLIASSKYLYSVAAFGNNWSIQITNNSYQKIENQLEKYFSFYEKEAETRKWFGFWNYGDVMHSYDFDRHNWKYDTGGFAWDNSELSTDLWLWYYYLRTENKNVFRFAEAMTRHTGEVDVHHIGTFAPLGSRHNVMHWGDSSKQLRISTVTNRRFLYYLTADERIGDLMHEQIDGYKTLQKISPGRKLPKGSLQQENIDPNYVNLGFGTDWGSIAAAWFTEWERTKNTHYLELLKNSMETIAAQPYGFFTGGGEMNIHNGKFKIDNSKKITVSHLNAVFGLPEILTEINASIENTKFFNAWIDYCSLYNASEKEQIEKLGSPLKKLNLQQGHARLTAYAAFIKKDKTLQALAWNKFYEGNGGIKQWNDVQTILVPNVPTNTEEIEEISTNAVAQWALAAMQCIAYSF